MQRHSLDTWTNIILDLYLLKDGSLRQVSTSMARLVFHYRLPEAIIMVDKTALNCSNFTRIASAQSCRNLQTLLHTYRDMKIQMLKHLKTQLDRVYAVLIDIPLRLHAHKRSAWSSFWSHLTGLAESNDVEDMKRLLHRLERGMQRAAEVWKSGSEHFMGAFKIENARINNIKYLVDMQRESIMQMQREVVTAMQRSQNRIHLWNHMFQSMINYTRQLSEVDDLFTALQMMTAGKLPHFFVSHNTLANALVHLEDFLEENHPELKLLMPDVKFYFRHTYFRAFRYINHLIIIIEVPLTTRGLLKPLDVYFLQKIPLLPTNSVDHYTQLASDIKAVIYHRDVDFYISITDLSQLPARDILDLRRSPLLLISRSFMTCGLALIEGSLSQIKTHCRYHVIKSAIPAGMIRLSDNTVLLSNVSEFTIHCPYRNVTNSSKPMGVQTVHTFPCGCHLQSDGYVAVSTSLKCEIEDNVTLSFEPKFLINLPYLSEFVEEQVLETLGESTYLNQSIPADLPKLAIASKEYKAKLGLEEDSIFDLQSVINQTLEDETTFESLSHYLYNVLWTAHTEDSTFDVLNWLHWLIVLASVCGISALVMVSIVQYKVRTLFILLATTRGANSIPTQFYYKTTSTVPQTTIDFLKYHRMVQQVFPVDLTLLLCFILFVIGFFGYLYYKYRQARRARTQLVLEVGNETKSYTWNLADLPLNAGFYRFIVDRQAVKVGLIESYLGVKLQFGDGLQVFNNALECMVQIPNNVNVKPWYLFQVKMLLNGPFHVFIHVLNHKDELQDVIILQAMQISSATAGVMRSITLPPPGIYPGKQLQQFT